MRSQFPLSRAAISLMHKRCSPFEVEIKNYQKNYRIRFNDFQSQKRIEKVKLSACLANCSRARVSFKTNVYRNAGTCSISLNRKTLAASCLDRAPDLWL